MNNERNTEYMYNTYQNSEWTNRCQDWLPVKLVRAMFDLGPDLQTRNHPADYVGEWRQVTYEEVHRATGLSRSKVKRMYWDLWLEDVICTRVHRPRGHETESESIARRNGPTDVQMHITAPWLRFNFPAFARYMQLSLDVEAYGIEKAMEISDQRDKDNGWRRGNN